MDSLKQYKKLIYQYLLHYIDNKSMLILRLYYVKNTGLSSIHPILNAKNRICQQTYIGLQLSAKPINH
jgi:hypothetical protein